MRTWLTDTFGIGIPVVNAPMAGAAGGALAAAVSRAEGLGMVGAGASSSPEWIASECAIAAASGLPFGVGVQAWVLDHVPGQLDAVLASGAALVSVSYGPYARHLDRLHDAGLLVATAAGTLADAMEADSAGVDLIVARGSEGGGHGRDDVSTLVLLQEVLDAVRTPVIAAGGISTARGLAAVLAAGACGAWVGTGFLTCEEAMTDAEARRRLMAASGTETVYTRSFDVGARTGWPSEFGERGLRNAFTDEWHGREEMLAEDDDAQERMQAAIRDVDYDTVCIDAGQGVGLLDRPLSAAEVMQQFAGTRELLGHAAW